MSRLGIRSWLIPLMGLIAMTPACGPGTSGHSSTDRPGREPGVDAGNGDSSVPWDSGPQFPDDDDFDPICTPKTCTQLGANCGHIDNGCGKLIDCGSCAHGETCGAVQPNVCGSGECLPKTCADLGYECGQQGDGCEGIIECGSCASPEFCGGGGPNQCGRGANCDNLCKQQVTCPGSGTTTLTGTVYNPAGHSNGLPLYGALVYVPNAELEAFPDEVRCGACADEVSGKPLVVATTDAKGQFVLEDVPVGDDIPLVIQLGRWRKVVTIPKVEACVDNIAPAELTRLPRKHHEDGNPFNNIPRMAMVTGSIDALECMIRKAGIDDSEFKNPAFPDAGRIHFYQGDRRSGGARINASTPKESTLWNSLDNLKKYDTVLLACQANSFTAPDDGMKNLADYADMGGRLFATHFSWSWLWKTPNGGFQGTATWRDEETSAILPTWPDDVTAEIDQTHLKGADFARWLEHVGASSTLGKIPLTDVRYKVEEVNAATSTRWIYTNASGNIFSAIPKSVQHYTFDTPLSAPAEDRCGRVLFSNFHVSGSSSGFFPSACSNTAPTPQEMALQFMMFDLASCALPEAPSCTPLTCGDYGYDCGPAGDGCGGILDCGVCAGAAVCGGAGPGKCGGGQCTPRSCEAQGIECGEAGDGCGKKIDCGGCPSRQWCGGGGPGRCGGIK